MTTRIAFAWLVLIFGACGGASSSAPRPRPLQYHFKEHYLKQVPDADRQALEAARAALGRAQRENRKAESDHASSQRELDAAKREASRAGQQKEAADSRQSSSEDSKDWKAQNLAKRDQRVAEVTKRAADQKVAMLEARRAWLAEWVKYTRENVFAAEARFELAKANLARAHNISPPDFAYQAYVDQHHLRRKKADELKGPADSAKEAWLAEKKEWEAKRRDEMEARGIDTAAKGPDRDDDQ